MFNEPKNPVPNDNSTTSPDTGSQPLNNTVNDKDHQRTVSALNKEKRKRQSKPILVIVLALLIAVLGGIATLAVYKYYFEKSDTEQSSVTEISDGDSRMTATRIIALVKAQMAGERIPNESAVPPAVKIAGKSFYSQLAPSSPLAFDAAERIPSAQADVELASLVQFMKKQGFEERKLVTGTPETRQASEFTHEDVICSLNQLVTANNDAADHSISLACANMTAYAELANAQQPLIKAYETVNAVETTTQLLVIGEPKVSSSSTPGYKTAVLMMSGYQNTDAQNASTFQGLYYQSPDKVWHFFKGTQNDLQCTDYTTAELKKAYAGSTCVGGEGKIIAPTS